MVEFANWFGSTMVIWFGVNLILTEFWILTGNVWTMLYLLICVGILNYIMHIIIEAMTQESSSNYYKTKQSKETK